MKYGIFAAFAVALIITGCAYSDPQLFDHIFTDKVECGKTC